jgi:hypothetical protein
LAGKNQTLRVCPKGEKIMGQFSPAVNANTNGGAEACLIGTAAEGIKGDTENALVEAMPESFAEQQVYRNDPFTIRNDHYVGHDGFVVPKDFEEFHQRFPDYVAKWVSRHADRSATKEDLEDWTQDLRFHLCCLPQKSKHREHGKKDVVQVFDPVLHHGANEARFRNYINRCLANKFSTMRSKRMKDALCRPANLSFDGQAEGEDLGSVCDEYCHSHSERLREAANLVEKQVHDTQRVQQLEHFVWRNAPTLLPVCRAIKATRNYTEAAALLGLTADEFNSMHRRLVRLRRHFVSGEPLPKQRKPYKKRTQSSARKLLG